MTDRITSSDVGAAATALDTKADAKSRGLRTALQALAVAIVVDAIPVLIAAIDGDALEVRSLVKAILRVVLAAVLAVVMRYAAPPASP